MATENKYERPLIWLSVLIFIGLIILIIQAVHKYWYLSLVLLVITSLLSFLLYKNFDSSNDSETFEIFSSGTVIVSFFIGLLLVAGSRYETAKLTELFVDGEISDRTYYLEPDGESRGGFKSEYIFKPGNEKDKVIVTIIDWSVILISGAVLIQTFLLSIKVKEKVRVRKYRKKYPDHQGDVPKDYK